MQLCECCKSYDVCERDKRKQEDPFAPCPSPYFELVESLTTERYEMTMSTMRRIRDEVPSSSHVGPIVVLPNDVPTSLEADEFLTITTDLVLDFANLDFTEPEGRRKFSEKHSSVVDRIFEKACDPADPGHQNMLEIQRALRTVIKACTSRHPSFYAPYKMPSGKPTKDSPIDILNNWLQKLSLRVVSLPVSLNTRDLRRVKEIRVSDSGETVGAERLRSGQEISETDRIHRFPESFGVYFGKIDPFASMDDIEFGLRSVPFPRSEPNGMYALLFLKFAEQMLAKEQPVKQCPYPKCKRFFTPSDRVDAGPTCGRSACKMWATRRKQNV